MAKIQAVSSGSIPSTLSAPQDSVGGAGPVDSAPDDVSSFEASAAPASAPSLPDNPPATSPMIGRADYAALVQSKKMPVKSILTDATQVSNLPPEGRVAFLQSKGFNPVTLNDGSTEYVNPKSLGKGLYGFGERVALKADGSVTLFALAQNKDHDQLMRLIQVDPKGGITNSVDVLP